MSVAQPFSTLFRFPSCVLPSDEIDPGGLSFIRNLTINQVMDFWWNLETFQITTSAAVSGTWPPPGGVFYSGTGNGTMTFSPMAMGGDYAAMNLLSINACAFFNTNPDLNLGQISTAPKSRVCANPGIIDQTPVLIEFFAQSSLGSDHPNAYLWFLVAEDSENPGMYAIGYDFLIIFQLTPDRIFQLSFANVQDAPADVFTSGTFEIAGLTFDWQAATNLPNTVPDFSATATMSASGSKYTY